MEDDDQDQEAVSNPMGHSPKRTKENISTDGMSLPDMSISFCENDETGEVLEFDAEIRSKYDDDDDDANVDGMSIDLDNEIKVYSKAISDYESLEEDSLAEMGSELADVLNELRDHPSSFTTSANPKIRALAQKRAKIFASKKKLGISDDLNYDSTGRKRAKSFSASVNTELFVDDEGSAPSTEDASRPVKMSKRASWQAESRRKDIKSNFNKELTANKHDPDDGDIPGSLSKKLSTKWAERLVDVNPTRGKLTASGIDEHGLQTFKIRPLWPTWLVDTSYKVIKKNKYGKRQHRIIKVTEHHFFNIKNGREITQSFVYSEMKKVWLKNQTTLVVSFGEDKVYEYQTEIALLIAQQLATRVQVRAALDKAVSDLLENNSSVSNFSKSTAALITSIEGGSSSGGASSIISFARTISESFLNEQENTDRGSSMWHRDTNGTVDDAALALRLVHLVPGSAEMLISAAVQDIMFDPRAPEGNTRKLFIEKFLARSTEGPDAADSKTLCTEVRHFIDGMHEYIMEKRGAALSAVFVVASSGHDNKKLNFRVTKAYETESGLECNRYSEKQYQHPALDNSGTQWWKHHNELTILTLSYLVFTGVEQSVCITLQDKIAAALPSSVNKVWCSVKHDGSVVMR